MLGRFLEFSLATPDIQASLDFYTRLGFSQAAVGEAWLHPYAVVTDGRICLGLHQGAIPAPSVTFVKPGLLKHFETLEELGLQFEFRRLGNDVFNEIGWFDPSGQLVRLIEARTFSPSKRLGLDRSRCGYFLEIALPAPDRDESKAYWERFGFVGIDEQDDRMPHVSCTSDFIDLGLYDPAHLRRSTLHFEVDDVGATLYRLAEIGISPAGEIPPPLRHVSAAMLTAPEGTPILLTETAETLCGLPPASSG
ncbi:MAG TPA: VOC family protein [Steroidobacteraceae bacterium]|nr:VOC family protein [Steroidobacteraceae bacterium]